MDNDILNFEYYNPTKIIFGKDSIYKIKNLINKNHKILVLIDSNAIESNSKLKHDLENFIADYQHIIYYQTTINSEYAELLTIISLAKKEKISYILAVGGGSVIDGAKFIACAINYPPHLQPWQLLKIEGYNLVKDIIPLGVILTLPASGSEMNPYFVISRKEHNLKIACYAPMVYPKFAILDPTYTFSLSKYQLALGIVDIFVHVLEQYVVINNYSKIQQGFSETILKTLIKESLNAISHPTDYNVKANIMLSSTFALNGLIDCTVKSDWTIHWISHELTALYGLSHAEAIVVLVKPLWEYTYKFKHQPLLRYAQKIWNIDISNPEYAINLAINKTVLFFQSLGIKTTLKEFGITKLDIEKIIDNIFNFTNGNNLGESNLLTKQDIRNILFLAIK